MSNPTTTHHPSQPHPEESAQSQSERRPSLFNRIFSKDKHTSTTVSDAASTLSSATLTPDNPNNSKPKKARRPRISDESAFKIITTPDGKTLCVENTNWPPGVSYKKPNRFTPDQGLGDFYRQNGAIIPGGENAGNIGPDPDWVPGLSEEEREKLKNDRSGKYVF